MCMRIINIGNRYSSCSDIFGESVKVNQRIIAGNWIVVCSVVIVAGYYALLFIGLS